MASVKNKNAKEEEDEGKENGITFKKREKLL